jgi:hypothetical protein
MKKIMTCEECFMSGNCIYQENNDMYPLGIKPQRRRNHE